MSWYINITIALVLPFGLSINWKVYHQIAHVGGQKNIITLCILFTVFSLVSYFILYFLNATYSFTYELQLVFCILMFKGIYNIYRHRQFPTKMLWALTDFTYVFHAAKGDLHYQLLDMHHKYGMATLSRTHLITGDVIRIQPNHLSFTSVEAMRDIHGYKSKAMKGSIYNNLFQPPGAKAGENMLSSTCPACMVSTLTDRNREYHDKFKRIFGVFFTNTALIRLEPTIRERLDTVVSLIDSEKGPFDITTYCKRWVIDVIISHTSIEAYDSFHLLLYWVTTGTPSSLPNTVNA